MKSTVSFSRALTRDNLKRYWVIPAIGLVAYVMAAVFPVVTHYRNFEDIADFAANMMLYTGGGVPMLIDMALASVLSIAMFSYLHQSASSMMIHAMPVTRTRLYITSVINGYVMMAIPVIVTGICMLPLRGATAGQKFDIGGMSYDHITSATEIYTPGTCLRWILMHLVILAFTFAIANLMAVISGNRAIHALLIGFALLLPYALIWLTSLVMSDFLIGYTDEKVTSLVRWLNPVSAILFTGAKTYIYMVIYLVIALLFALLGLWTYHRVKLERVGDACVFPRVADIICVLLSFILSIPATLFTSGIIMNSESGNKVIFLLLLLINSLIFYLISRMIADGTTRVFHAESFKKYGVMVVLLAIFCAFTVFDITGYQNRIPEVTEVASLDCDAAGIVDEEIRMKETNPATIEKMQDLQRALIEDSPNTKGGRQTEWSYTVVYRYHLKSGRTLVRSYMLDYVKGSDVTKKLCVLYDDPAIRRSICVDVSEAQISQMVQRTITDDYGAGEITLGEKETAGLIEAYNKDVMALDATSAQAMFEEYSNDTKYHIYLEGDDRAPDHLGTMQLTITKMHPNTLAYIRDKGYAAELKEMSAAFR